MSFEADIFVGTVAILLGGLFTGSAIFNWEWSDTSRMAHWIQVRLGRHGARVCYGSLGLLLIALGSVVLAGLDTPWAVRYDAERRNEEGQGN